jgi:hypothetical protein
MFVPPTSNQLLQVKNLKNLQRRRRMSSDWEFLDDESSIIRDSQNRFMFCAVFSRGMMEYCCCLLLFVAVIVIDGSTSSIIS